MDISSTQLFQIWILVLEVQSCLELFKEIELNAVTQTLFSQFICKIYIPNRTYIDHVYDCS